MLYSTVESLWQCVEWSYTVSIEGVTEKLLVHDNHDLHA